MHEVGIMNDALEIAEEAARASGATKIKAIHMKIGELSGVSADALSFAFDVVASGTMAEGGKLDIEAVHATSVCDQCGCTWMSTGRSACELCGGKMINTNGYELLVSSIEVD